MDEVLSMEAAARAGSIAVERLHGDRAWEPWTG